MKFCLVQAMDHNCLYIRSAGPYDWTQIRQMIRVGSRLDFYEQRNTIMHDMRMVEFSDDLDGLVRLADSLPDAPRHGNMAIVADSEAGFRMVSVYASIRAKIPQSISAFHRVDDAMRWLGLPGADAGFPAPVEEIFSASIRREDRDADAFQLGLNKVACGTMPAVERIAAVATISAKDPHRRVY